MAQRILLTGLPNSFLARGIFHKLCEDPENELSCLVPQPFVDQVRAWMNTLGHGLRQRVDLIVGDVAAMDFGLPGPKYLELAARVHSIYHCPQVTQPGVERRIAEALNIDGTAEVLELGEAARNLQRIVHFSSALVSGKRHGHVLESELIAPTHHTNIVEETLFRAEHMVRDAMDHLPITVLRPSIVVGDSVTGAIERLEGPYLLILLMLSAPTDLRVPLPGRGDVPLNLVPMDYVIEAGCAIAKDPRTASGTFHLVDSNPLTARRVFELIAEQVGRPGPVGSLPAQVAAALLRTPGLERFSHIPRAFLEQLAMDVVFDDRNTREVLAGTGIRCPPASSYLKVMVEHVRREQRTRSEAGSTSSPRHHEEPDDPLETRV